MIPTSRMHLSILSSLFAIAVASGPTSIFVNQVPEYALLADCAESQVSTIVRDMKYGCGDGSQTTSYACFCYQSSARFSSIIGAHVASACSTDASQNSSAVDVFSSYCQLGQVAATPTVTSTTSQSDSSASSVASSTTSSAGSSTASSTAASSSVSASPAAGPATVVVTATPTSTPSGTDRPSSGNNTHVVATAVGVAVPISLLALAALGFFIYRARKKSRHQGPIELGHGTDDARELPSVEVYKHTHPLVEIGSNEHAELDSPGRGTFQEVHELDSRPPMSSVR